MVNLDIAGLEVVPLQWSVQAMQRALERVRATGWDDPVGGFAAIGETLWWIGVAGDRLRTQYERSFFNALAEELEGTDRLLAGLRFARNRIGHGVDKVNYVAATATESLSFRATWTWKSMAERPSGNNQGFAEYQSDVAGKDVVQTLLRASVFLAQVAQRVSDHRP